MNIKKLSFVFFSLILVIIAFLSTLIILTKRSGENIYATEHLQLKIGRQLTNIESFNRSIYLAIVGLSTSNYPALLKQRKYSNDLRLEIQGFFNKERKNVKIIQGRFNHPEILKSFQEIEATWEEHYLLSVKILRSNNTELKGNPLLEEFETKGEQLVTSIGNLVSAINELQAKEIRYTSYLNKGLPFIASGLVLLLGVLIYFHLILPLDRSKKRLATILEDQSELILRFDKNFNLLFFNQAYKLRFEQQDNHNLQSTVLSSALFNPESITQLKKGLASIDEGETDSFQMVAKSLCEEKYIRWSFRKCAIGSGSYEFQGTGLDISKDIMNEKIIKDQEALLFTKSKLSALGEMAAGIAHEINNPLAIIAVSVSAVRRMAANGLQNTPRFKEVLDDVDSTVFRITKIVMGLRNISRDAANEEFQQCKLKACMEDVLSVCSEKFRGHGINLQVVMPTDIAEVEVQLLRVQFSQVLLNLLNNSFDELEKLNEKWIRVTVSLESDNIKIVVTDSGKGIPISVQEKIFLPFFTTKEVGKGTGLGLSVSHTIIQKHGGKFYVDNNSPNTSFVVSIPKIQNMSMKIS